MIAQNATEAVVKISTKDKEGNKSFGTGFFLTSNGIIGTCYHVVKDATDITVHLNATTSRKVVIHKISDQGDVALLASAIPSNANDSFLSISHEALSVKDVGKLYSGFGFSTTDHYEIARCIPLAYGASDLKNLLYGFTGAVNAGDSGGPVVDRNNRVVGLIYAKDTKNEGHCKAVPAQLLMLMLDHNTSQSRKTWLACNLTVVIALIVIALCIILPPIAKNASATQSSQNTKSTLPITHARQLAINLPYLLQNERSIGNTKVESEVSIREIGNVIFFDLHVSTMKRGVSGTGKGRSVFVIFNQAGNVLLKLDVEKTKGADLTGAAQDSEQARDSIPKDQFDNASVLALLTIASDTAKIDESVEMSYAKIKEALISYGTIGEVNRGKSFIYNDVKILRIR